MTFVGSPFHHIPSSPEDDKDDLFRTCLYCGENWPCEPVMIKRLVIARVVELIEPTGERPPYWEPDPAARYEERQELVKKIKEL